ncbi:S1C family serine protease [Cellvibrio japonicus]|uniref:AlgW protein n=1 Tax=Cellvibrio japonicus (strain Ueda107) TaxID=498211 RepID=B3PBM5_CELJU|nr:trypsin-like peptidase domain-containing protein [Cellvibrio japonicus]ACE83347.1 AlgW protein [Cellvibrio japonicus Ueda107]QEI13138.1 trypsin-like serine protease [Cellvibrio japonicus]QEI16712.1 trypsin-like serine protease [Cellvibrio japonicus]QEI20290.1 trypsin-like serine protease [Cellvibrio japonicus]
MKLERLVTFLGWPIAAGIIIALLVLLLFPQLRLQQPPAVNAIATPTPPLGVVSYADAVSRAAPAVVNVYTEKRVITRYENFRNNPFYRHLYNNSNLPQQERMEKTLGSGVIVDASGLILTNNHVINSADRIAVLLYDGRVTSARLVGIDNENDLAVLKIQADNITPIPLGDSDKVRVGDVVLAIGNPFGVGQSVSQGIVSATGRWNVGLSEEAYRENFIQTDAAINPGNSGGALINAYGNLIGINTAVLDETNNSAGISFAVPAKTAMESLRQIAAHGRVIRGWLGIEGGKHPDYPGIYITNIVPNAPAHLAGLLPGDALTHINGEEIRDERHCMELVNKLVPGDIVKLRILRNGQVQELEAIAGERSTSQTKT